MSENIIIADADHIDKVAFDLIVNFERMLGRRIPQADMARWIDCIALDGGLREGEHDTQVVLIHNKGSKSLKNFTPADFSEELNNKAFKDHLGEFTISALPVEELTTKADFLTETVEVACQQKEVKRIMVIPADEHYQQVATTIRRIDAANDKHITVFSMEPRQGGNFRQEILGFSLMAALGIRSHEIHS